MVSIRIQEKNLENTFNPYSYRTQMGENLAELVARRGRELNISNAEIARRAEVSRGYIGNIVNRTAPTPSGTYNLSPDVARRLAKALEVKEIEVARAMDYVTSNPSTDDPFGLASGMSKLSPQRQAIAKKQIAAILDALAEEEHDTDYID